jgi:hypothetical protein
MQSTTSMEQVTTVQQQFCQFGIKSCDDMIKVIVRLEGVPKDDEGITSFLTQLDAVYATNRPFVCLYDVRAVGKVPASVLWTLASYLRKKDDQTRKRLLRCAVVFAPLSIAKKLFKSLFVFRPPACPLQTYEDIELAKEWLRKATLLDANSVKA